MKKWEYLTLRYECLQDEGMVVTDVNGEKVKEPFYLYLKNKGKQGWQVIRDRDNEMLLKRPTEASIFDKPPLRKKGIARKVEIAEQVIRLTRRLGIIK